MPRKDITIAGHAAKFWSSVEGRLIGAGAGSVLISALIAVTARDTATALGAPLYRPWLLTGLQVLALWSAGSRHWWGWLLGAGVQLPWVAYALMTGQLGFIPGCAVSAVVQVCSFVRAGPGARLRRGVPRLSHVEEYG
jgi:hypothetical protein